MSNIVRSFSLVVIIFAVFLKSSHGGGAQADANAFGLSLPAEQTWKEGPPDAKLILTSWFQAISGNDPPIYFDIDRQFLSVFGECDYYPMDDGGGRALALNTVIFVLKVAKFFGMISLNVSFVFVKWVLNNVPQIVKFISNWIQENKSQLPDSLRNSHCLQLPIETLNQGLLAGSSNHIETMIDEDRFNGVRTDDLYLSDFSDDDSMYDNDEEHPSILDYAKSHLYLIPLLIAIIWTMIAYLMPTTTADNAAIAPSKGQF